MFAQKVGVNLIENIGTRRESINGRKIENYFGKKVLKILNFHHASETYENSESILANDRFP